MKIWEVLKRENIGKRYKAKIYGKEEVLKVDYDINSKSFLTLKRDKEAKGIEFPLENIYLHCILNMDFEEVNN